MSTEITTTSPAAVPATLHGIDRYLEATASESAPFLKFTKGEYTAGVDEEPIEIGREVVPHVAGITSGHVKWEDKRPVDESMTPVVAGMFPPRDQLGDLDKDLWEIDDRTGEPRDPWQRTMKMPVKDPETGEEFVFSTSSRGGIGAIGKLLAAYRNGHYKGKTGLPVIRLDVDSYRHKEFGKVHVPFFPIVAWKTEQELLTGEAPSLDDELNDSIPY